MAGSSTGLIAQLKTGEIDVATVDPAAVADLEKTKNVSVVAFDVPNVELIAFQLDPAKRGSAIFRDKSVRQALLYGLDRQAIAKAVYYNQAKVADAAEPPVSWAHSDTVRPIYRHDKKKAAALLDAAGWRIGSSGIRLKNGTRLSFEMVTTAELAYRRTLVETMEAQLEGNRRRGNASADRWEPDRRRVRAAAQLRHVGGGHAIRQSRSGPILHVALEEHSRRRPQCDGLQKPATGRASRRLRRDHRPKGAEGDVRPDSRHPGRGCAGGGHVLQPGIWGINNRVQSMKLGPYNRFGPRPWMKDVFVADGK